MKWNKYDIDAKNIPASFKDTRVVLKFCPNSILIWTKL